MSRILRAGVILGVLLMAAGCTTAPKRQRVATYFSPTLNVEIPSRIVVVPFDGPSCTVEARKRVTRNITRELQGILLCDVTSAPMQDTRLLTEGATSRRGSVDIGVLIAAKKTYRADYFLFGTITQYKEYDPPVLGLKLRMLSARTGEVVWAAEALYDAHAREVRELAEDYFDRSGLRNCLYGPGLVFMSPEQFGRFVAAEVVSPFRQRFAPSEEESATGKLFRKTGRFLRKHGEDLTPN